MNYEQMPKELKEKILNKIGAIVKRRAIIKCPIDLGNLRASIDYRIEGDSVFIFAESDGAIAMEYGEPPHELWGDEAQEVKEWAERHGANPWAIIKSIEKHGIKVGTPEDPLHITSYGRDSYRPFLRPAVYESFDEIRGIIQ